MKSILVLVGIAATMAAADKPNFSGDWKVNLSKSELGFLPPPTSFTRKISHSEPKITIADDQRGGTGDQVYTRNYTTDGKEIAYNVNGADVQSAAVLQGDALMITSKALAGGMEFQFTEKFTLSDGGKTLTDLIHIATAQGEIDVTYVFERQ